MKHLTQTKAYAAILAIALFSLAFSSCNREGCPNQITKEIPEQHDQNG